MHLELQSCEHHVSVKFGHLLMLPGGEKYVDDSWNPLEEKQQWWQTCVPIDHKARAPERMMMIQD